MHTPLSISVCSRKNSFKSKVMKSLTSHQKSSKSLSKPLKKSGLVKLKKMNFNKILPDEDAPKHIDLINQAKKRMKVDE